MSRARSAWFSSLLLAITVGLAIVGRVSGNQNWYLVAGVAGIFFVRDIWDNRHRRPAEPPVPFVLEPLEGGLILGQDVTTASASCCPISSWGRTA